MFKRVQEQLGVLLKTVFYSGKSLPKSPIGKKKQQLFLDAKPKDPRDFKQVNQS
jgi:hypothetical protein